VSVWFYQRKTWLNPVEEGPHTESELIDLARQGKITAATLLRSPTKTANKWIAAQNFPTLMKAAEQGKAEAAAHQEALDEAEAALKEQRREDRRRMAEERALIHRATYAKQKAEKPSVVEQAASPPPLVQVVNVQTRRPTIHQLPIWIGLAGAAMVLIGTFLPFVSISAPFFQGSMNILKNGRGDGIILCFLMFLTGAFAIFPRLRLGMWATGFVAFGIVVLDSFHAADMINESEELSDLANLDVGVPVMIIGSLAIVAAAAVDTHGRLPKKWRSV
jgi:hypothetical protein